MALVVLAALAMGDIVAAARAGSVLDVSGTHRSRYEHLSNQFREGFDGSDAALAMRTTLLTRLRLDPAFAVLELADSRLYLDDDDAPLNTTLVNPIDLLQAHISVGAMDGAGGYVRVGRMTMDVGSRRLVASNRFRNTINAFTGLDAQWRRPGGDILRGFVTVPVERRPKGAGGLDGNEIELDREMTKVLFWGAFYGSRIRSVPVRLEFYLTGLHERDSDDVPTRNRGLVTPGLRVVRDPERGRVHFQVETAIQWGSSRKSADPDDTTDLNHAAWFAHASFGYTAEGAWRARFTLAYDYASGDRDPGDDANERFDTLFGARRFDYGPTGIYGALARGNLSSPAVRAEVDPHPRAGVAAAYRAAWLAEARDAWTASNLQDTTGGSGTFIGHQLEVNVTWRGLPGGAEIEGGVTRMWLGGFPSELGATADPIHVYVQAGVEIP
jgi:hypothetical protein